MCPVDVEPVRGAERMSFFHGGTAIVENLDLAILTNAFTALVAPNGSGKSTVLRALASLLPLKSGDVRRGGQPIARLLLRQIGRHIGMSAQAAPGGAGPHWNSLNTASRNSSGTPMFIPLGCHARSLGSSQPVPLRARNTHRG